MATVTIERRIQVNGYKWTGSEWIVICEKLVEKGGNLVGAGETFEILAGRIVPVSGNHAQRTTRPLGIKIPITDKRRPARSSAM